MLTHTRHSLPSWQYFDPAHYQLELRAIWQNEWLCIGRTSEWPDAGSFRVVSLGDQQIVITRTAEGALRAFHNSCRHRGSLLCETASGRFAQQRIVCPYHAWTYSLEGDLQHTPRRVETADFDPADYSLHAVAVDSWAGFVFINLAADMARPLPDCLGDEAPRLANWPMDELALAHRETHEIACNWKVFWENFCECYHCPGVHTDLCRLVPLYGTSMLDPHDLPDGHPLKQQAVTSRLAEGAVTWSSNGQTPLPEFEGLTRAERDIGMTFATILPGIFIVAHVDYVRCVQVLPLGPEQTRLTVDWLLLPDTLQQHDIDLPRLVAFGNQVVLEDARVCELNQRGLHCQKHEHGVLMPQEYDVLAFDDWVRQRLA